MLWVLGLRFTSFASCAFVSRRSGVLILVLIVFLFFLCFVCVLCVIVLDVLM